MLQYPNGNGRDQEINSYALPILIQETIDSAERADRHGQRRDRHQRGYLESLQSALDQAACDLDPRVPPGPSSNS